MPRRILAIFICLWLACLAFPPLGGKARGGLVRGDGAKPAVVLVGGGPGGQRVLNPLATALRVGGYQVVSLAPDRNTGGLAGLVKRIGRAVEGLRRAAPEREINLVSHGAGGLAAIAYLQGPHPAQLKRALFMATPVDGLRPPPGGSSCRDEWRRKVLAYYGQQIMQEAAPGSRLQRRAVKGGVPLDLLVGSLWGRLNRKVADAMLTRAGCARDLAALAGDGVIANGSLAHLPGFGRDDRDYIVLGDHLGLPARRQARDLAIRFLHRKGGQGSVAVVLVIDGSGSVRSVDKAGMRLEAVRLLISRLMPGDQVGVVSFNTKASTVLPLAMITSRDQARKLAGSVASLPAKGDTDIGAGLARAGELLEQARPGRRKIVVLLTDGRNDPESANGPTLDTVRRLAGRGVQLYAVGLTDKVDELFLSSLAREAKGSYLAARDAGELVAAFDRLQAAIDGRSLLLVRRGKAPAEYQVLVDSTIRRLDLSLMASRPGLELKLKSPTTGDRIQGARGCGYATYTVRHPSPGLWRIQVQGPRGASFQLQVAAATNLKARLGGSLKPPQVGRPWYFSLEVVQDDLPLADCKARLRVTLANGTVRKLVLKPVSAKGFSAGRSSSGVLSGVMTGLDAPGNARLEAVVSGLNRLGEPFQRLMSATIHISDQSERRRLQGTLKGRKLSWGE